MKVFLYVFIFFSSAMLSAQVESGMYLKKQYVAEEGILNYRIMYPYGFSEDSRYPLVLFLHGMGERGTNNETQLTHGSKLFQDSLNSYPAIVVFPQCPPTDYWANLYRPDEGGSSRVFTFHTDEGMHPTLSMVTKLVEEMLALPYVDENRFYISGLSMGAMGVWELLWRMPDKIAAALPICGGGPTEKAETMKEVPVWAFHGVQDNVVHFRYSVGMVRAIQRAGGKAKISLYQDANHNSWDPAFAEPKFLKWMFSKSK